MKQISMIVAIARNRAIGFENKLLYWLPNDLKRFKALTLGHTIIMGRKTFESLPKGALPGRRNIVLSRDAAVQFRDAEKYDSLEEALARCGDDEHVFIIGGASVYQQAFGIADRLHITLIDDVPAQADAFFPEISPDDWKETERDAHPTDEKHPFSYSFVDYIRKA